VNADDGLLGTIQALQGRVRALEQDTGDRWRWATVTQASPLRVRLDGDDAALLVTPDTIGAAPVVGQRVWCQIVGRRVVVHTSAAATSVMRTYGAGPATWTRPAGLRAVRVRCWGAGGAGGGRVQIAGTVSIAGGGGGGAYAEGVIPAASLPATVAVTVGEAGIGVSGADGGAGGGTAFGTLLVAGGGAGGTLLATPVGTGASTGTGAAGGSATSSGITGALLLTGQRGDQGYYHSTSGQGTGGAGGSSPGGGAGGYAPAPGRTGASNAGTVPGGGGSGIVGNAQAATAGGSGADGRLVIEELY